MRKTKIKYPWTSLTTSKIRIFAMVFSISFFKAILINEGETTGANENRGETSQGRTGFGAKRPGTIRLSLWPFPSQLLPSDLSGFIVLPNTTRYFVPYSEHTTLFPPFQIGRVLISGWNLIGLSCLPKAFIYLASNTADGLSAFFRVFLYFQICFHNFSVLNFK
jgi:hypothetical protein